MGMAEPLVTTLCSGPGNTNRGGVKDILLAVARVQASDSFSACILPLANHKVMPLAETSGSIGN